MDFNNKQSVLLDVDGLPLHQRLRYKRIYDGFTQTQLVKLLRLPSVAYLSRMETGKRPIPKQYMERIESYLYREVYENGQLQTKVD